jgi:hypothetical protein
LVEVAHHIDRHSGVVGVYVRFGPVPLDDQLVVAIGLYVQVTFARVADHLHRQVVRDSMVQQRLTVKRPNLCALITHEGAGQPETLDPRDRAGVRPSRARHHGDACARDAMQRLDVSWIEIQPHVDDRSVEVQG